MTLDVGEDRLVLHSSQRAVQYHVDLFLPHSVSQSFTSARFDNSLKVRESSSSRDSMRRMRSDVITSRVAAPLTLSSISQSVHIDFTVIF